MSEREAEVIAQIQAVDQALARREMSAAASERVRQALLRQAAARPLHARLRWWPMVAFAAGAALMAALLVDRREADPAVATRSEVVAPAMAAPEVVAPAEPDCDDFAAGELRLGLGDCVAGDGVHISAWTPATIERIGDRVEVRDGELIFTVDPRPGRPLHVFAGAIDIEVVGTRFAVHQREGAGRVSLFEGRLRVRTADGSIVAMERGQQLEWSAEDPPPDAQALPQRGEAGQSPARGARRAPTPATEAAPATDRGLAELLAEVAGLRRSGQFQAAVERLREADASEWSERSRQLVSYEIGTLLERQLGDMAAACAHWREHRRRFPGGLRDDIVARSITRLGCAAP